MSPRRATFQIGGTGGAGGPNPVKATAKWLYDVWEFAAPAPAPTSYDLTGFPVYLSPTIALNGLVLRESDDYSVDYAAASFVMFDDLEAGDVLTARYQYSKLVSPSPPLQPEQLAAVQWNTSATSVSGSEVTPTAHSLLVAIVFMRAPVTTQQINDPIVTQSWDGALSWTWLTQTAGHQPDFSWVVDVVAQIGFAVVGATPAPSSWTITGDGDGISAPMGVGLWQIPLGKITGAHKGSNYRDGFLHFTVDDNDPFLRVTIDGTPASPSIVLGYLGYAHQHDWGSVDNISPPLGFAKLEHSASPTFHWATPDDYGTCQMGMHLSWRVSPIDSLTQTWQFPAATTAAAFLNEVDHA